MVAVDLLDRLGGRVQHRVAVLHDGPDGHRRPCVSDPALGRRRARNSRQRRARRLQVVEQLGQRVAAELLEQRVREHPGHHRLADHARGGHDAGVAALDRGRLRLLGAQVDRAQRHEQGRDGLDHRLRAQLLAVGDAALEPARAVAGRGAGPCSSSNRISSWKAEPGVSPAAKPAPSATAFTAWIDIRAWARRPSRRRSHCAKEPRPGGTPRTTTSNTPPTVSPAFLAASISAIIAVAASGSAQRTGLSSTAARRLPGRRPRRGRPRVPMRSTWLRTSMPAAASRHLGQPAGGDARGRLARARALEHVAQVVGQVLERAREVGVAGPRVLERAALLGLRRLRIGRHHVRPVRVVPVADEQGDGAAERHAVADAGEHLHRVALDLHAAAAAVAALAPPQVGVDGGAVHGQARGQALDDDGERGAVRFAGGQEAQARKYTTRSL